MKVYIAVEVDRHTNPTVELFIDLKEATTWAHTQAVQNARLHADVVEQKDPAGDWLYYVTYSEEGDYVFVIERELQLPTEEQERWNKYWAL